MWDEPLAGGGVMAPGAAGHGGGAGGEPGGGGGMAVSALFISEANQCFQYALFSWV
jgi:hypothetical protein